MHSRKILPAVCAGILALASVNAAQAEGALPAFNVSLNFGGSDHATDYLQIGSGFAVTSRLNSEHMGFVPIAEMKFNRYRPVNALVFNGPMLNETGDSSSGGRNWLWWAAGGAVVVGVAAAAAHGGQANDATNGTKTTSNGVNCTGVGNSGQVGQGCVSGH